MRLLNNIAGKSETSSEYPIEDDMDPRITDQRQVAQLLNEKFVTFGTCTFKKCIYAAMEYVLDIETSIKTIFLYPVSRPEILLLVHKLEERNANGLDKISASLASIDDFRVEFIKNLFYSQCSPNA